MGGFERARGPKVEARLARPEDAAAVVGLFRAIHPDVTPLLVYGCRGAVELIRRRIQVPAAVADTVFTVISDGRIVAGCAEIRRTGGALVLKNIAVHPGFRSQRLGSELLATALKHSRWGGVRWVELDVFEQNQAARAWYERLGFKAEFATLMCEAPLAEAAGVEPALSGGLARAQVVHSHFGFSQFVLRTAAGHRYTIGRIGARWFRVSDEAALLEPSVLASLALLGPGRRCLAVVREGAPSHVPLKTLFRRFRLRGDVEAVLGKLG